MQFLEKSPRLKKFLRYFYFISLHILAAIAGFLILTALAVQFKWTNQKGSVDINSRYFSDMADKYNQGFNTDSLSIARDEFIMFRTIGILAILREPHRERLILICRLSTTIKEMILVEYAWAVNSFNRNLKH